MVELEIAPRADEVIRPSRVQWWLPLIAIGPALPTVYLTPMIDKTIELRPLAYVLPVGLIVLYVWYLRGNKTVLTDAEISCRQLGRPWRPGHVRIPWTRIVAIEARKGFGRWRPVLHLDDGSVVWVGAPNRRTADRRFAEMLDPLRERHLAATGRGPDDITVPQFVGPPRLRQLAVTLVSVAVVAAFGWAAFSWLLGGKPPAVDSCALVSAEALQKAVPDAKVTPESSDWQCYWTASGERNGWGRELTVFVQPSQPHYARAEFTEDRLQDTAEHNTADIPDLPGYFWSSVGNGKFDAEAKTLVGGYRVSIALSGGTDAAAVEQQVIEVARSVTKALR
ncbi:hypothetical protein [Nocardia sp. XZ_19_385]|uniref:hypothetical protein n=1 Tax=Nocardia sp. XZ_19_385 TaxID=2769488 RepID=UPI00188E76BE|nr:hypothetical protein [Nocardia sp. XZ_19_385]